MIPEEGTKGHLIAGVTLAELAFRAGPDGENYKNYNVPPCFPEMRAE
jgi:hypothetical protein